MVSNALNKLLDFLSRHLSDKESTLEIEQIRSLLSTHEDIPAGTEAMCRILSLAFTLPVTELLMNHVASVCNEALLWSTDKELLLNAVDCYLDHEYLDQTSACLVQSWLLWQASEIESATKWAEAAHNKARNSGPPNKIAWSQQTRAVMCTNIGSDLWYEGNLLQAEKFLRQACELSPEQAPGWVRLGSVLMRRNNLEDAISNYERALQIDSGDWYPWGGIADVYRRRGNLEKAEIVLRRGISASRNPGQLYHRLGFIQSKMGDFLSAIFSYQKALNFEPKDARLWSNLGFQYEKFHKDEEATKAYRKAIDLNPCEGPASRNLIRLLLKAKRLPDACEVLQRYLEAEIGRLRTAPLWLTREFTDFIESKLLTSYDLLAGSDDPDKPLGCGQHIVDRYLTGLQQSFLHGLKMQELKSEDVVKALLYIGMLWSLYAEKLSQKNLSKQFARERLYAIKHELLDTLPQREQKVSGFASSWPEIESRMKATSPREFAREMIRQEPMWLKSVGEARDRGEVEDLRSRLQGYLWVHVYEYQSNHSIEHLERIHFYMELLKGHTLLHKLAGTKAMEVGTGMWKWNRYVNTLPVKVDQTAVADLEACAASLPENSVALSFYFLDRPLLPKFLLVTILKPGEIPRLKIFASGGRLEEFLDAATCLKQIHHRVAWREKVPAVGSIFCKLSGDKTVLKGRKLVKAIAACEKKHLRRACKAILDEVIDIEEIRGRDLYVSPSPEMYDIPFGLLLKGDEFINSIVKSITIVPIFSLKRLQQKGHDLKRDSLVLCLNEWWEKESKNRAEKISSRCSVESIHCKVERQLAAYKGDVRTKYNEWFEAIAKKDIVHIIGEHDASQWSRSTKEEPNLGQFGHYLYHVPENLSVRLLALEACWGGTWSEPKDLMGLFVSFLASSVSYVVASPYSVVPITTSGRLFSRIYDHDLQIETSAAGLQIASALRETAEEIRLGSLCLEDSIPTMWGALQLYASI